MSCVGWTESCQANKITLLVWNCAALIDPSAWGTLVVFLVSRLYVQRLVVALYVWFSRTSFASGDHPIPATSPSTPGRSRSVRDPFTGSQINGRIIPDTLLVANTL